MEAQRFSAAAVGVIAAAAPGRGYSTGPGFGGWYLLGVSICHGQESQFSRLLRPLALGKADFACARWHRLRRRVEAASETVEAVAVATVCSKSTCSSAKHGQKHGSSRYTSKQAPPEFERVERAA